MLRAVSAILPCSCLPHFKQADKQNVQTASYDLTSSQASPTQPPTIIIKQEEEEQDKNQTQTKEPAQEVAPIHPPTEDDPDSTLTAIEASIEPKYEDDGRYVQNNEEQAQLHKYSKRASAPPNLELNISYDPLPNFSLNSRSRLSYWGPPPHLPPSHPLPAPLVRLHQPRESLIDDDNSYSA